MASIGKHYPLEQYARLFQGDMTYPGFWPTQTLNLGAASVTNTSGHPFPTTWNQLFRTHIGVVPDVQVQWSQTQKVIPTGTFFYGLGIRVGPTKRIEWRPIFLKNGVDQLVWNWKSLQGVTSMTVNSIYGVDYTAIAGATIIPLVFDFVPWLWTYTPPPPATQNLSFR